MKEETQKVLVIGLVWPEPNATAAGIRTMQILQFFIDFGANVTFVSTASKTQYTAELEERGVKTSSIELNDPSFDEFLETLQPTMVVFDRYLTEEQFGWKVAKIVPNAMRIVDTQDLHSLRISREQAFKEGAVFNKDHWFKNDSTKRELASIYRSDLSLIISDFEIDWLLEHAPMIEPMICYFPFLFDTITERDQKSWLPFNERAHFIFIGNGKHRPNTDAILWLKQSIWPLIRKEIPTAKLAIYGPYFSQQIQQLHDSATGFLIMNWAPDAKVVMASARVNLIPLRTGAGIKGKHFLGLTCGTPSVTTEIGAEGIYEDKDLLEIALHAEDFAKKAIDLYADKSLWKTAQHAGIKLLNTRFLKGDLDKKLEHRIKDLQCNLETHRARNILGGMLLHHTLASTKYLSKWIELKNTVNPNNT